ncbi:mannan endo-1,4-beta-mannosidase [Gracilibacillus ureilyticus]|uniref:Mannan endo-1,4-beta-mannosidase n=1 Tax=Gracilibacillus ureilyticus TaxID=531814 RepID=A0A1H9PKT2_9BACI|nr:glycosyl hydrolase [Gracilibacillus ureilyticus]SER48906.1 mannan endo-1,4-beta-mannosidase [Gracilibacillus ureilyticus]
MKENLLLEDCTLSNPNAIYEAKKLFKYICSISGESILSGQQESDWKAPPNDEMEYIKGITGKLPAIRGLDYINEDYEGVNKRSIEWWELGGIVSICWHWGMPPDGIGYESSKGTINLNEALTEGTPLYSSMVERMDEVAQELKKLQEARVPVLWRPFHEFDGEWFWWGKGGAELFVKLWCLMYERYTRYHGLNNLIWVLGYSGEIKEGWYPGDNYVDIAGADTYNPGPHAELFQQAVGTVGKKMPVALHECGPIPNPAEMIIKGANWVWFLTWHTIHVKEQNTPDYLRDVYNHQYVITLDKLPSFKR